MTALFQAVFKSFQIYFREIICLAFGKKLKYRVIRNDCRGFNNATSFSRWTPYDFYLWGYVKDQVYVPPLPARIPELKVRIRTAIETIVAGHATNSLERNRLSCYHKGYIYRAPVRYVTKTWSVVLLNKKNIYSYLKCIVYDKLLKPRQSFRIKLYIEERNFHWPQNLKQTLFFVNWPFVTVCNFVCRSTVLLNWEASSIK